MLWGRVVEVRGELLFKCTLLFLTNKNNVTALIVLNFKLFNPFSVLFHSERVW